MKKQFRNHPIRGVLPGYLHTSDNSAGAGAADAGEHQRNGDGHFRRRNGRRHSDGGQRTDRADAVDDNVEDGVLGNPESADGHL